MNLEMKIPATAAPYLSALRKEVHQFTDDTRVAHALSNAKIGIRVVTRSLDDLTKDDYLDPKRDNDWTLYRFLAQRENGDVMAGDVSNATGTPHLVSVSRDSRIETALRTVRGLDQFKILADDNSVGSDYEISLLRVSGVLMEAIWLRSTKTGKQYVIPILVGPKELRLGALYNEEQLRPIVQGLVSRFRNIDTGTPSQYPPEKPTSM